VLVYRLTYNGDVVAFKRAGGWGNVSAGRRIAYRRLGVRLLFDPGFRGLLTFVQSAISWDLLCCSPLIGLRN